ncbi:MAG: hypothetical protein VCA18_04045, partial [Opitutales bacterium]
GQGRQRQPPRPVVGPVHGIKDETVLRAGADFPAPTLLGNDNEWHIKFSEGRQSRVIGRKIEQFDLVALGIPISGARATSL